MNEEKKEMVVLVESETGGEEVVEGAWGGTEVIAGRALARGGGAPGVKVVVKRWWKLWRGG